MSRGGSIYFKCRRCNVEYTRCHAPDVSLCLQVILEPTMRPLVEKWGGAWTLPDLHDIHHCGGDKWGIADLVGGTEDLSDV